MGENFEGDRDGPPLPNGSSPAAELEKNGSKPNEEPAPSAMIAIQASELDQIKKDAAEYKDKYLRLLAESDNYRKRMQKERQEMVQFALQNTIIDFLTPIDQLENALKFAQNMSSDVKQWALGFQMILNQFTDVLANSGVVAFDSTGKPFDPHHHEAVEMVTTNEHPPGIVIKQNVRGYKMGDKTIRAARVSVSQQLPKEENEQSSQSSS